jgi:tryptophan halogenase
LAKKHPELNLTWVYPENNNPIGVGEALVPEVSNFLNDLGLNHKDIIRECNATLKLGIKFKNFNGNNDVFTFPFGITDENYNSSSIEYMIDTNMVPKDIFKYEDISIHIRTTDALPYIKRHIPKSVSIIRKKVNVKEISSQYDIVIDTTGFSDKEYSIEHLIPNNRALSYRQEYTDISSQLVPYSTFVGCDYGWIWNIPLKDHVAVGYVYYDKYDVNDEFVKYIEDEFKTKVNKGDIQNISMKTGRKKSHINGNIVNIGLSSTFIEPLESTGLYLVTSSLKRISRYINGDIEPLEYNKETNDNFDVITSFIQTHYKYSNRSNDYWDYYKNQDIELYGETSIFPEVAWDYILSGFGKKQRPINKINIREQIQIKKGIPYHEWLVNEKNFK